LTLSNPATAAGERYDDASGLQYLNARYYDPRLAMFIQPDWWEVMQEGVGTNRYSYSFGDPVNGRDPSGNYCVPCVPPVVEIVGWAVGGLLVAAGIVEMSEQPPIGIGHNGGPPLSGTGTPTPEPPRDPRLTELAKTLAEAGVVASAEKLEDLGTDPIKGFDPAEAVHGARYEKEFGVELSRSPHVGADFVIKDTGITVDAMGPAPSQHFNMRQFANSLRKHLLKKVDRVSVDGTGLTAAQREAIKQEIEKQPKEAQDRIDTIRLD
jgi:RHS repeat-associated protein